MSSGGKSEKMLKNYHLEFIQKNSNYFKSINESHVHKKKDGKFKDIKFTSTSALTIIENIEKNIKTKIVATKILASTIEKEKLNIEIEIDQLNLLATHIYNNETNTI